MLIFLFLFFCCHYGGTSWPCARHDHGTVQEIKYYQCYYSVHTYLWCSRVETIAFSLLSLVSIIVKMVKCSFLNFRETYTGPGQICTSMGLRGDGLTHIKLETKKGPHAYQDYSGTTFGNLIRPVTSQACHAFAGQNSRINKALDKVTDDL